MQLLFSAIMFGFQLCNIKDYIRLSGEQNEQLRKVEQAVQEVSTELDTFARVAHNEIMTVLRLRGGVLGDSLRGVARDIAGDLMLLRYARFGGGGGDAEGQADGAGSSQNAITLGATVTVSLARRKAVGADSVRERILRDDMVRSRCWL